MSILDPLQKQLAVDVFDEKMVLRPELREQLLGKIYSILAVSNVSGVYLIGTITGYQYTETSDIDVNVSVLEYSLDMRDAANKLNGFPAYGSRHPVNLNIKQNEGNEEMWQDCAFGIYNVLKNDWTVLPQPPSAYRDPNIKYQTEIEYAKVIAEEFNRKVTIFKEHVRDLTRLRAHETILPSLKEIFYEKADEVIKQELQDLVLFVASIEEDRKMTYKWGWGSPREDFRNIVFKYLEHGGNGKIFEKLEKVKLPDEDLWGPSKKQLDEAMRTGEHIGILEKGSELLPAHPEIYHIMKQEQRQRTAVRNNYIAPIVGGITGLGIGAVLGKNKTLMQYINRLAGTSTIGAASATIADQLDKKIAMRNLMSPDTREKDYNTYQELASKLISKQNE